MDKKQNFNVIMKRDFGTSKANLNAYSVNVENPQISAEVILHEVAKQCLNCPAFHIIKLEEDCNTGMAVIEIKDKFKSLFPISGMRAGRDAIFIDLNCGECVNNLKEWLSETEQYKREIETLKNNCAPESEIKNATEHLNKIENLREKYEEKHCYGDCKKTTRIMNILNEINQK